MLAVINVFCHDPSYPTCYCESVVSRKGAPGVKFTFTGEHVMIMAHICNVQKVWLYIHDFPKF